MGFGKRLAIFLWWICLESVTVYSMARSASFGHPDSGDWFMAAMLGTMLASMLCAASSAFIAWVFFGWEFD